MPFPPVFPLTRHEGILSEFSRYASHIETAERGTMSTLFKATTLFVFLFCSHVSTIGWVVEAGIRASRTSTTTSTLFRTCGGQNFVSVRLHSLLAQGTMRVPLHVPP
jgi:hypothetical protein